MTGLLILDVTDQELALLRAVRDTDFAGDASRKMIKRAVERGLIDEIAGSYGGLTLATPGRHTLWKHDRPDSIDDHPWERCHACGSTDLALGGAWQAGAPLRATCRACGFNWVRP